jgi:glycosyltransferase involved in cell wall biosynthesis
MFSVVIPYYKKRQYIERCIEAVLSQTFQNFEIIVVDDGSQDDIAELISNKYANKITLIQQSNQGVSAARNAGIAKAKNEYIAFLDADDYWSENYLALAASVIAKEGNIKMVGCYYTRNKEVVVGTAATLDYHLIENYFEKQVFKNTLFTSSSSIIHRSFFENNPGFNPTIKRGEDLDVWFRTVASGGKIAYINNPLVYYSDEDIHQATNKSFNFNYSIVFIMADDYLRPNVPQELQRFAPIFVRKRIFPYFFDAINHEQAKTTLNKVGYGNVFSRLLYQLPIALVPKIIGFKYIQYYSKYLIK